MLMFKWRAIGHWVWCRDIGPEWAVCYPVQPPPAKHFHISLHQLQWLPVIDNGATQQRGFQPRVLSTASSACFAQGHWVKGLSLVLLVESLLQFLNERSYVTYLTTQRKNSLTQTQQVIEESRLFQLKIHCMMHVHTIRNNTTRECSMSNDWTSELWPSRTAVVHIPAQ